MDILLYSVPANIFRSWMKSINFCFRIVERKDASILKRLDAILGFKAAGIPVFVNGDPRGYALKIEDSAARDLDIHRDMGGYGIICPDF